MWRVDSLQSIAVNDSSWLADTFIIACIPNLIVLTATATEIQ